MAKSILSGLAKAEVSLTSVVCADAVEKLCAEIVLGSTNSSNFGEKPWRIGGQGFFHIDYVSVTFPLATNATTIRLGTSDGNVTLLPDHSLAPRICFLVSSEKQATPPLNRGSA